MRSSRTFTKYLAFFSAAHCALSATYSISSHLTGQDFIDAFTWAHDPDPNWGRVNYVDYETAQAKGLFSVDGEKVTFRADSTTVLNATGPGRDSFDLVSKNQYTTHVAIFDIVHMPEGCGTWPAVLINKFHFRELGPNWPSGGEIDIVEGINDQTPDSITLHTGAGCMMPATRAMSGTSQGTNCDAYETGNESCGVKVNASNSYGPQFNSAGGGWYVIERSPTYIKVFFWGRQNGTVPCDVSNPGSMVNPDDWGTPAAYFPSSVDCNFATHLGSFEIVINLDFCGAWAGNQALYSAANCPSTCADFVNKNPSAFKNAYFTFNALTIYE